MPSFPPDSERSIPHWWARCCSRLRLRAIIALEEDPLRRQELVEQLGASRADKVRRTPGVESPSLDQAEVGLELLDSQGQGSSVSRIQPWGRVIALAVVALSTAVVTGGWLGHSSTSGGQVATGFAETSDLPAADASEVESQARQLQAVIGWLGLDRVDVVVRGATIHVSGEVPTNLDRVSVLEVVGQFPDDVAVDVDRLNVATRVRRDRPPPPPGAPPRPTQKQLNALQLDLDAALSEGILRFETGSSVLDDDRLEFLATKIVNLLVSHGSLPVAIVVQDDPGAGGEETAELRVVRTTYVRDFLVARGLPPFSVQIASATADGSSDPDGRAVGQGGDSGGLVTLKVIDPPTGPGPGG